MTFSGHLAVTAFVLRTTTHPLLVVFLCFFLHLAADAVPHLEWPNLASAHPSAKAWVGLDLLLTLSLTLSLYRVFPTHPWLVSAAILCSLLPDLSDRWTRRFAPPFRRLHLFMHSWPHPAVEPVDWDRTITGRTKPAVKLALQAILVLSAQFLLLKG